MFRVIVRRNPRTLAKGVKSVQPSFGKNASFSRSHLITRSNIERAHFRSLITTSNESIKSQLRRERIKSTMRPIEDPDSDVVDLRDRLGSEFELNWEFNRYGVTPSTEAYRNLHLRGLVQRAPGKTDANKALHVELKTKGDIPIYAVAEEGENTIPRSKFSQLAREVEDFLSEDQELFMHDGAIGSSTASEVTTRIITDSPTIALFSHHMIPRKSLSKPAYFTPSLTVLAAIGFKIQNPAQYGVKSSSFGVFDPQSNQLYYVGSDSLIDLQSQMVAAATAMNQSSEKEVVTLACDSILADNGTTSLVFSPNQLFLQQQLPGTVFGAHHHFLSKEGLSHAWTGIQTPTVDKAALRRGDLVTKLPDGSSRTIVASASPNEGQAPSQVIFLVNDTRGALPTVSKLSPAQACQHLLAGYNGSDFAPFFDQKALSLADSDRLVSGFKALTEKAEAYLVSTNAKGKQLKKEELASIFSAIQSGEGTKAKTESGYSTLSPIKSLKGVKGLEGPEQDKLKKLEEELAAFLKSKFPNAKV